MSSGCSSCESCDYECKATAYINSEGYQAVKCPTCETEIIIYKTADIKKLACEDCGTVMEIIPFLLN